MTNLAKHEDIKSKVLPASKMSFLLRLSTNLIFKDAFKLPDLLFYAKKILLLTRILFLLLAKWMGICFVNQREFFTETKWPT